MRTWLRQIKDGQESGASKLSQALNVFTSTKNLYETILQSFSQLQLLMRATESERLQMLLDEEVSVQRAPIRNELPHGVTCLELRVPGL